MVGWIMATKDSPYSNCWNLWMLTLFGKRHFAGVIKDFEMKLSWIIWEGQCNYKYLQVKEKEGQSDGV